MAPTKRSRDQSMEIKEDRWIPTTCGMCYSSCPIRVRRVNGVPVKIEGDPRSSLNAGSVCGKGAGSLSIAFDPNRINTPVKRTNPKKGVGIDPGWQEISWDEALDTIAEKLREVYNEDPRQLKPTVWPAQAVYNGVVIGPFAAAFGAIHNMSAGAGGMICGNAAHFVAGLIYGAWSLTCDFNYCNYLIHFGASKGHAAGHGAGQMMRGMAEARARGMKQVAIDPVCNFVGGKATEWMPIIPGTDGAVALAMLNVILNEVQTWDDVFIKTRTNGPYLVAPDKHYVRDKSTNKPLVWDVAEGKAKTWDDPTIGEFAIQGNYEVNGIKCVPAFQLLRDHVKKYTPEMASEISGVPATSISRIAREFVEAARIGSTITIKGKPLPYRPAAAICFRGINGHTNAYNTVMAINLLNLVIGAADVPGGAMGWPTRGFGYPQTGRPRYEPTADPVEGMMRGGWWWGEIGLGGAIKEPMWPVREPTTPEDTLGLGSLYPMVVDSPFFFSADREEMWEKAGLPYRPKVWMNMGNNLPMSGSNFDNITDVLTKTPFVFSFDVYLSEFTEFDDIVLPDASYLETLSPFEHQAGYNGPVGLDDWCFQIRQPVVEPGHQRRMLAEILPDLAERIDPELLKKYYFAINGLWALAGGKYALDLNEKYTWEQMADRGLKNWFGDDHGLEWFKENGCLSWPKQVEEVYWRYEIDARVPIYSEFIVTMGENVRKIAEPRGIEMDWEQYIPLPEYFPCPIHKVKSPDYDLYAITYRDILHTGTMTQQHPEIDQASMMNPYTYNIMVNEDVAKRKGLKDGDSIWVESDKGRKTKGTIKLAQGIHPQVIAFAGTQGHWSKYMPIALGKGSLFNDLLEIDKDHVDPVSLSFESAVKVKIYKKEECQSG